MADWAAQDSSERFALHVDALAVALQESGAADAAATRLLASASAAVMQALTLELMLAPQRASAAAEPLPVAAPEEPAAPEIPLAA